MVFESIREIKPKKLYLIADGPKNKNEEVKCQDTRNIIEGKIDWVCKVEKAYSKINLGCAQRITTGLNWVFKVEEKAIILEDDTLPNKSFFNFCEELLNKYQNDKSIYHISGCNFHPELCIDLEKYFISSVIHIWGWATWADRWKSYDLEMRSWQTENKDTFLRKWCPNRKLRKETKKIFDLHCENKSPWTWDYQWVYSCWKNNGFGIIPTVNLVKNIGVGKEATNMNFNISKEEYPAKLEKINFPINQVDSKYEYNVTKNYLNNFNTSLFRKLINYIKN